MNAAGLQAREMGGTVQYRQGGGGIQEFLSNPATGDLGQFLYRTGQNDPNAIDAFNADEKTKGAYTQKLNELNTLLSSGQITQSQYDTAKNDLLGVKITSASELKSNEERVSANQESIDACLLYTSPSPRDRQKSRMPSSA